MRNCFIKSLFFIALILAIPAAEVIAADDIKAKIRFLYVQPGQTLHNIVTKLYPERKPEWAQLRRDIVRLNPHAFASNNETQMKAGVKLRLPAAYVAKTKPVKAKKRPTLHVGDVYQVRGQALAVSKGRKTRSLAAGDQVYLGDKLITGADGYIRLRMIDNAILDLRCYSIMVIEDYDIQSANRRSVFNLLQGSLRKVTGEIGKWKEDVYELRTPVASVGVRGTEYALRVFQSKGCDGTVDTGDDGMYLKVIKGLVDVHNNKIKKKTVVAKGDTLYIKTPEAEPVKNAVKPGIIEPEVVVKEEDDSISAWWWLLLLGLFAL